MGRQVVEVQTDSTAAPDEVWRLLADVTTWPSWSRFDEAAYEKDGLPAPHGVGAVRRFRVGRLRSTETVLAFEPPTRLSYDYVGSLPIKDYRADVTLGERGAGGTHITWHSEFAGKAPLLGPLVRPVLTRVLHELVTQLARAAEAHSPPIAPDTKDWTWVVQRRCPECGLDAASVPLTDIGRLIRENAASWASLLAGDADLRERPTKDRWSLLEYSCHVRDVFRLYHERLQLMLTQDDPCYPNWDQDETAVAERYNEQDPSTVATELGTAARALADAFDAVRGEQWQRTGMRGDGASFTVESFARYLIHDPVHHLHDVSS